MSGTFQASGQASDSRVRVVVFEDGQLMVETLDLPARQSGEIDISLEVGGICGSDLHTVLGRRSAPPATALGHEGLGRIRDIDLGVRDLDGAPLSVGDRIVFSLYAACHQCDRCRRDMSMKCRKLLKYGHDSIDRAPHATGTLADQIRLLEGTSILKVPDDQPAPRLISAGCAVATAAAVDDAAGDPEEGARALVMGAGAVGLYAAAMLSGRGFDVDVRDISEDRITLAKEFGLNPLSQPPQAGTYAVAVEATGSPAAFEEAFRAVSIGGRMVAVGSVSLGSTTVALDPAELVTRRLSLIGLHNYTPGDFRRGVHWLLNETQGLPLERLASPVFELTDIHAAFREMQAGRFARVLVAGGQAATAAQRSGNQDP